MRRARIGQGSQPEHSGLRGQGGFTVTELLVSVVIVSIGVVGYVSAVGLASTELWFGRRDSELSMLVSDQLESMKAMGQTAVTSGSRVEGPYRMDWQVQGSNPKKVTLIVQYDRGSDGQQQDTLVAYVR